MSGLRGASDPIGERRPPAAAASEVEDSTFSAPACWPPSFSVSKFHLFLTSRLGASNISIKVRFYRLWCEGRREKV